jgi:hypothetical protein
MFPLPEEKPCKQRRYEIIRRGVVRGFSAASLKKPSYRA